MLPSDPSFDSDQSLANQARRLDDQSYDLRASFERLESDQVILASQIKRLSRKEAYWRNVLWIRTAQPDLEYWRAGVLIVLPFAVAAFMFSVMYVFNDSVSWSFLITLPVYV